MLFARLDIEKAVQVGDLTRFIAEKSLATVDETSAIATCTIAPGLGATPINVFNADPTARYLDWVFYSQTFDIITGFNDKIDFQQGSDILEATLAQGSYTMAQLLSEIETEMEVEGDGEFSASIDQYLQITIVNDTEKFELLPEGENQQTSLLPHIGFVRKNGHSLEGLSVEGFPVEYSHKKITVTVNNGGSAQSLTKYIKVFTAQGDCLFSDDEDLVTWEPDVVKWVATGRSSFLREHREAQEQVMYYLDRQGYTDVYGAKFTKFDIIDHSEVNEWSKFLALSIIYWGISNKKDDVFLNKHYVYVKKYTEARDRAILRLDINRDKRSDPGENSTIQGAMVVRR